MNMLISIIVGLLFGFGAVLVYVYYAAAQAGRLIAESVKIPYHAFNDGMEVTQDISSGMSPRNAIKMAKVRTRENAQDLAQ